MSTSKPKKILHIVGTMSRGGAETWLMHVLRNIDRSRFHMDFLVYSEQPEDYDEEIYALGGRKVFSTNPKYVLRFARDVERILKEYGPYDVVHSHILLAAESALRISKKMGVPIRIVHGHNDIGKDMPANKGLLGLAYRFYAQWALLRVRRYATCGLACSELAAKSYFGLNWRNDPRYKIFLCGEDFSSFRNRVACKAVRKELGIPEDAFVIGHVGRFDKQKNHVFIIKVVAELVKSDPNILCLLVGAGVLQDDIKKETAKIGLEKNVIFAGGRSDVPRLMLGAMDMFLFPSLFEGLGLVLIEAQAAGLPCVFSDVIPSEVDVVLPLINRVSLSQSASEWAKIILSIRSAGRLLTQAAALSMIEESGFNIFKSIKALEAIYSA